MGVDHYFVKKVPDVLNQVIRSGVVVKSQGRGLPRELLSRSSLEKWGVEGSNSDLFWFAMEL